MKQNQRNERKSEILLQVPNPKKIQAYSVDPTGIQNSANPNTQSETKEIRKSCP
jgi:hypothetical protein